VQISENKIYVTWYTREKQKSPNSTFDLCLLVDKFSHHGKYIPKQNVVTDHAVFPVVENIDSKNYQY